MSKLTIGTGMSIDELATDGDEELANTARGIAQSFGQGKAAWFANRLTKPDGRAVSTIIRIPADTVVTFEFDGAVPDDLLGTLVVIEEDQRQA